MSALDSEFEVPVIDLTGAESLVAAQVAQACRDWGFFQVIGHGVPPKQATNLESVARDFFSYPQSAKRRILRTATNPWGFFDAELTKNTPDWKEVVDIGPELGEQRPQWPAQPARFRPAMETYTQAMEVLARRLTALVLGTLGDTRANELTGFVGHTSFLRLNYYPLCPSPAPADTPHTQTGLETAETADQIANQSAVGRLGISHHTDSGALTVLQQWGPAGLQVLRADRWHTIEVVPDALVINIGDVAQVWSNDRYIAPLHRVLANRVEERFSAAYFFNPSFDYDYGPLLSSRPSSETPAYRAINWGEFRAGRTAGDYADQGEEIQISHFRTT